MTNKRLGVLYVGVTSNLPNRATQHREGAIAGFTKRYNLHRLVWYRCYGDARNAIDFEKRLKRWRRAWKIRLIEEMNPEWRDLWPELMGHGVSGPLSNLDGVRTNRCAVFRDDNGRKPPPYSFARSMYSPVSVFTTTLVPAVR